ncbi:MAG TPA: YlmC/YmxH family sporulation protein [Candidatus Alectryocaccomicrobium excrementavium]|uniref:YlmC/YmxH family sporulation protein n=1 Tax=Candidatus Alectryocaccomicrobium excrementavium TaxID=2840668 RepID=A0A9D1K6A7_9FIRM|nr:YlmC/YmxH family sporulation protein [Candidatus Alectryocaccomicrobium excrementavium]
MTFSQLRDKDVINVPDGRKLGKPIDLAFCENAMIEAIVVPGPSSIWNCLSREREGCAIPWNRIRRIGDDVILVDLDANFWNQQ